MAQAAVLSIEAGPRAGVRRDSAEMRSDAQLDFTVQVTHHIAEVEEPWRALERLGIDSPGQSFDFIRLWAESTKVPLADQLYVVGSQDGRPVALLPLCRKVLRGVQVLTWFPGSHVGCNAPLVDAERLAALGPEGRSALWHSMLVGRREADVVYLKAVPKQPVGAQDLFAELGTALPVETLYRAQFASWEQCNTTQRNKSRRKHDRQQGERLDALGAVGFETVSRQDAPAVLEIMFRQRAARFAAMGVTDPFASAEIRRFYERTLSLRGPLEVKLHALRLNGDVVALRYNVAHADHLFCLISSMSADAAIQVGSPGKQCLLRVMQTVFEEGYRVFDMGAGLTDEKRHWCNVQVPLEHRYVALTPIGRLAITAHQSWHATRRRIKSNKTLARLVRAARQVRSKVKSTGSTEPAEA